MMADLTHGWKLTIERGPDCLVVRVLGADKNESANLADIIWARLKQHFTYRLVIELGALKSLPPRLIEELTTLADRIEEQGGMLRLCGIPEENRKALKCCAESGKLPHYPTCEEAVVGRRPAFLNSTAKEEKWLEY